MATRPFAAPTTTSGDPAQRAAGGYESIHASRPSLPTRWPGRDKSRAHARRRRRWAVYALMAESWPRPSEPADQCIAATGWAAPPGTDRSWRDPVKWAHRIEAVDKRKNSRQCRDDVVGIPVELVEAGAAEEAVQAYADRLAAEHNTVVHFALHKPDRGGRNHHAHVLYPGRHVAGLTFSRKRDREQDNPKDGGPDLVARHKAIWSDVCRDRGLELDWTSEAPGHHLGPALCAVKRARLVEQTRETIRETVAVSTPGEPAPDRRTLQAVAEIATRVNDGLTVTEMLERERDEALQGRPAPRPVPAPSPFRPEVVPASGAHEVLPPVKRAPEVLPPATAAPEVLPPRRETPRVLPPVRRPEVLPPARQPAEVFPPGEVAVGIVAARVEEEHPRESAATWSEVERHNRVAAAADPGPRAGAGGRQEARRGRREARAREASAARAARPDPPDRGLAPGLRAPGARAPRPQARRRARARGRPRPGPAGAALRRRGPAHRCRHLRARRARRPSALRPLHEAPLVAAQACVQRRGNRRHRDARTPRG